MLRICTNSHSWHHKLPQEATAVATYQSQLIQLEQVKPKSQIKPWKTGPQRRGDTVGQGTVGFWRFYTGELEN